MRVVYVLSIILLFSLFSCKTETLQCTPAGVKVYFVGFTFGEASNAMVFVYKKDNLFDSLIDSVASTCQQKGNSDTMMMLHALDDDHDYHVKLPGSNTVYSITGLTLGNHYTEKHQTGMTNDLVKYGCVNNTVSYTLNGQQSGKPNVMSGVYNVVYINK
jgi:hypothetical protein